MKSLLWTTVLLMCSLSAFCQKNDCENGLDTSQVIKIAKRHNAYWAKDWLSKPGIELDIQKCQWKVNTSKRKYTRRGQCKHTNGCVLIKTRTLLIDAKTRKVLSRNTMKELKPSYE